MTDYSLQFSALERNICRIGSVVNELEELPYTLKYLIDVAQSLHDTYEPYKPGDIVEVFSRGERKKATVLSSIWNTRSKDWRISVNIPEDCGIGGNLIYRLYEIIKENNDTN